MTAEGVGLRGKSDATALLTVEQEVTGTTEITVPDSGSTLTLLALGLTGVAGCVRGR